MPNVSGEGEVCYQGDVLEEQSTGRVYVVGCAARDGLELLPGRLHPQFGFFVQNRAPVPVRTSFHSSEGGIYAHCQHPGGRRWRDHIPELVEIPGDKRLQERVTGIPGAPENVGGADREANTQGGEMPERHIIRFLTEKEEAELHLKDLRSGANTFDGCIEDIRRYTPGWLDKQEVEARFRKLARKGRTDMSYEMTIHYVDLETTTDEVVIGTRKMHLGWYRDDRRVDTGESFFAWDEGFIDDLLFLRSRGVRGQVILRGDEGEYERYVLDDRSVKRFTGIVSYRAEPDEEFPAEMEEDEG